MYITQMNVKTPKQPKGVVSAILRTLSIARSHTRSLTHSGSPSFPLIHLFVIASPLPHSHPSTHTHTHRHTHTHTHTHTPGRRCGSFSPQGSWRPPYTSTAGRESSPPRHSPLLRRKR